MTKWRRQILRELGAGGNVALLTDVTVTVFDAGTSDESTIYSDDGVTPKSNPFTVPASGVAEFWAADGLYDVQIESDSLGTTTLESEAVGLVDDQVVSAKIDDGAVTSPKLAAGAVGTTALASSAVTTAKLADANVTRGKLDSSLSRIVEPIYGAYNIQAGLQRWRRSLGMARKNSAGTGSGGIDVVILGDSIAEGGVCTNYRTDAWPHLLKLMLRAWLNPSGVTGGYGFAPLVAGTTSANWSAVPANGILATAESKFTRGGTGNNGASTRWLTASGAAGTPNHRMYLDFDPAGALGGIDYVELVAAQGAIAGNVVYDITVDQSPLAYVTTASAGITGTVNTNGGSTIFGKHWGRIPGSPLTASSQHTVQLSYNTGTIAYWDGLIGYNGDWDCGCRVHSLGSWGADLNSFMSTTDKLISNVDAWGTGALNTGATNARLFVMDFMTNDIGTDASPTVDVATFKTRYGTLIDRALALTSKPSVLLVIPPCRNNSNALANWPSFVTAIYELADARSHVAVLDLFKVVDEAAYTSTVTDLDWDAADATHYSDTFQQAVAEYVFNCLRA